MTWHEHGSVGTTCATIGLDMIARDCELRKGMFGANGKCMTDDEIIEWRRSRKGAYYIYVCPQCLDMYAHTPKPVQLLRYNLEDSKGDCPNCGIVDIKVRPWGAENMLGFKNWNHSQLWIAGKPAEFKILRGKHKRYEPTMSEDIPEEPPRYTVFGNDWDD